MGEKIGEIISRRRVQKEMSQRELATAINLSNSTIARIERGDSIVPDNTTLRLVAETLDMDYNYLLAVCGQIDDEPVVRKIQRAVKKMTEDQKQDMLKILQISFREAFSDVDDDM